MPNQPLRRSRVGMRGLLLALFAAGGFMLGIGECNRTSPPRFQTGHPLFTSPQFNPVAVSQDGDLVYVANTTSGTVSVIDTGRPSHPVQIAQIPVGIDPTGLAVRPKLDRDSWREDEFIFVANHISDSVSVISRRKLAVVQTLQGLAHADGGTTPDDLVTTTDEPVGIAFQDPCRAFVTLGQPNQVIVLEMADSKQTGICDEKRGEWSISPTRLAITAQAPRALAVSGSKLYVAAFESGNQTQFPSCAPGDPRGFTPGDPFDEGCLFQMRIIDDFSFSPFKITFGTIFNFAARDPNIGGQIILNRNIPDRDLFVYDLTAPGFDSDPSTPGIQPAQVVTGVGTLLYGVAVGANSRVYVTNTDARNHLNGLRLLGNRMFDNRISYLDCAGGCGAPVSVDLDASATTTLGTTAPTPYGLAVSKDGATLVVTAAGSDGTTGFPGLYTLDASGHVLGGVRTGAIPQGVALRSNRETGAAERAFVLNTVDSTLSVVDVEDPSEPSVVATIEVGSDPTPPAVKAGRIAFSSARASTSGTFSCESCHPNGNIDQLLWTINAFESPTDPPGIQPPEPRTTMPIRGLRDTLPLHWEGRLADPYPNPPRDPSRPNLVPGDVAPDCNLETDGEIGCIRTLVNASLSGVMCAQPSCPVGPSGLPGALSDEERTAMATFLQAVSFPPAPERRPSDKLSQTANLGVQDFFTDEDGLGIGHGLGGSLGFGVITCSDNAIGCHSLPLTVGTDSKIVGLFDAPSARGLWDRHILFSDGLMSSYEFLQMAQDCADGIEPVQNPATVGIVSGDPCNLQSPLGIPLAQLPFPSHAHIYDPAEGITERGAFLATFEGVFALAYGVRGDRIWQFQVEMGTGLPGLTGRQVSVTGSSASDPDTIAQIQQLEQAAIDGKIVAIARAHELEELKFDPSSQSWKNHTGRIAMTSAQIRDDALGRKRTYTLTAELPSGITGGGPDRQPLLDIDPDLKAAELADGRGQAPHIPKPTPGVAATFRVGVKYVAPGAQVLVDGTLCTGCGLQFTTAQNGDPAADVSLAEGLTAGMHVIQVHNPNGWVSNELPVLAK